MWTACRSEFLETHLATKETARKLNPTQQKQKSSLCFCFDARVCVWIDCDCIQCFMYVYFIGYTHQMSNSALFVRERMSERAEAHIFIILMLFCRAPMLILIVRTMYMCMEVKVTLYVWYVVYVFIHGMLVSQFGCPMIQCYGNADMYVFNTTHTRTTHTQLAFVVVVAALECVLIAVYSTTYTIA